MNDVLTIKLEQVRLHGYHGVFEQERTVGAEFEIDIEAEISCKSCCSSDLIANTISYADIYETAKAEFDKPSDLLEHLVKRMSDAMLERWPSICSLTVKVTKLSPPIPGFCGRASVSLTSKR